MKKHMYKGAAFVCELNMRWMILFVWATFMSLAAYSQHQGYRPVGDLGAFKKQFAAESSKIASIESTFTQEKVLTALTEKITSTGKFWFKRSNKVRIEYIKPYTYTMIMNGDKMLFRDDQKENKVNVRCWKVKILMSRYLRTKKPTFSRWILRQDRFANSFRQSF
jgi:outer membrane lipoprotein-sorting protein